MVGMPALLRACRCFLCRYTRLEGSPTLVLIRGKSHAPPLCLVLFDDFDEAKTEAAKLADMVGFPEFKVTEFYTSYKPDQEL